MEKRFLTAKEVAEMLGVAQSTVYNLKKEGLPYFKIGGSIKFDKEEVLQWIDKCKVSDKK
ncbi:helix-turn-helix transcriptional regulator [Clostridium brassicae]|uniref:Helix-turn-helix domain-containing protein n=1 Tax=Clostridium brassicae TaxID=2999072 RepID=A0ABT4D9H7_9CLOT|nr:helix-turn-helix domain-containing protein [Clostridium brassicae]MCY6957891.1 helix-turn-helix domain-containing protein [Clostridium brassicae]